MCRLPMYRLLFAGILACCILIPAATVQSQSSRTLDQLYGQGVHAYYSGELQNSMNLFSKSIKLNSRDPRVYFFRGLVQSQMGDDDAATADFKLGAQLEATSSGRHYAVGQALERVQGKLRLQIEHARHQASYRSVESAKAMASENTDIVRPMIPDPTPADQATTPQTNFPDVTGIDNPGTPFDVPMEINTKQPVERAATPEPTVTDSKTQDPFGGKSDQQTSEEQADPFGEPAGKKNKSDDPFADEKTDDKESDPKESDPFADDDSKQEKSPPDDPFGDGGK